MTLIRWSPAPVAARRDITGIQDEVDRLFDGLFSHGAMRGDLASVFTPAVDIEETPEEFVVRADLPGVDQKDVKVSLMGDTVTIRGERRPAGSVKQESHLRVERVHGSFERSFTLGTPVRSDTVKAQYRDGVLEVRVPKAEEARMRQIEVQVD